MGVHGLTRFGKIRCFIPQIVFRRLIGRQTRLRHDEEGGDAAAILPHGFFGKTTRIGFIPLVSSSDIVGVSPWIRRGHTGTMERTVQCLDPIHFLAYATKVG